MHTCLSVSTTFCLKVVERTRTIYNINYLCLENAPKISKYKVLPFKIIMFYTSDTERPRRHALTQHGEVYGVLPVPCGERRVFTNVSGLIRKAERRKDDGRVLQRRSSPSDRCVLEGNAVPVRRGHWHTQRWICYRHILLGAVRQFLPCYLEKLRQKLNRVKQKFTTTLCQK